MSYEFSQTGLGALLAPTKLSTTPVLPTISTKIAAPTSMLDRTVSLPVTTTTMTMQASIQPTIEKVATNLAFTEAAKVVATTPTLATVAVQMPVITRVAPVVVSPVQAPVRAPTPDAILPVAPTPVLVKVPVPTQVVLAPPTLAPVRVPSPAPLPVLPSRDSVAQQAAVKAAAEAEAAARIAEAEAAKRAAEQAAREAALAASLRDQQIAATAAKQAELFKIQALQAETAARAAEAARIKEQEAAAAMARSMIAEAQRLKDESYKASQQVETLQFRSGDIQTKIDDLNQQLYSPAQTPQSFIDINGQIQALTADLAVTESEIPAAEAQAEATAIASQDLVQQASILDAGAGLSWFSKNRKLAFVIGAVVVGVGYWYYRKNKSQLPPPGSARAPSGLSRNRR